MSAGQGFSKFLVGECAEVSALLAFYVCGEASDAERSVVESHVAVCSACAEDLAQEGKLHDALSPVVQPADVLDTAGVLLAQCRSLLAEKIDDLVAPPRKE